MLNKVNVGGILFDNVNMNEAVNIMENKIIQYSLDKHNNNSLLLVANQDILNKIDKLDGLTLGNLNKSFLIVPDGNSIIIASRILKTPLKERVAGPDLMDEFLKNTQLKNYTHFFLGSKDEVLIKLKENLLLKYPELKIIGSYSPPICKSFSDEENNKIINMINNVKPDVVWVSFGCPKQESWIIKNYLSINVPILAGIGAAFDFHSGNLKRAPKWMRALKIEWFYRLIQEPKRLWKRYFLGGINFIKIILKQKKEMKKGKL
jgi:N-acetylglucosaminyldiphosphoundecaprenol N-acetyl-beta-D-mannosaminyltransferase